MSFVQTLSIDWLLFLALQVVYEMLHEKSNKAPYVKITANKAMSIFMVSPSHDFIHRLKSCGTILPDSVRVKRCRVQTFFKPRKEKILTF